MKDFVDLLNSKFEDLRQTNPRLTLRGFSELFDENPSYMHRVINRDISISVLKIYKYSRTMCLEEDEICDYVLSKLESILQSESSCTEKKVE